ENEAKELVANAVQKGIENDLYSGHKINIIVLKKVGKKVIRQDFTPYRVISEFETRTIPAVGFKTNFEVLSVVERKVPQHIQLEMSRKMQQMEVSNN
ncbi:MAG: hypothetical protein MHPSP_002823, partial [Paramarteilia canceri]